MMTPGSYKPGATASLVCSSFDQEEDLLEPLEVSQTKGESLVAKCYWEQIFICIYLSLCFGSIYIALRLTLSTDSVMYV
jgi:hypothetical protein